MDYKTVFKTIDQINIPKELFNPLKIGEIHIDKCLSELGGIIPSQVIFLDGIAGAGKTTLTLFIAEKIVLQDKTVVFISLEMSDFQLKLLGKRFPNLNNPKFLISTSDNLSDLFEDLIKMRPSIVILDSIQKAAGTSSVQTYFNKSFNQCQISLVEKFTKFAKETLCPVVLIGHVGKDGNYIGPSCIAHEVDTKVHLDVDIDLNERSFICEKNRFGGLMIKVPYYLNNDGLVVGDGCNNDAAILTPKSIEETEKLARESINSFVALRKKNGASKVSATMFFPTAKKIIDFLKSKYYEDIKYLQRDIVLTVDEKIPRSCCKPMHAKIMLSNKQFSRITSKTTSSYKKEKNLLEKRCSKTEHICVWITIHEFVHLFEGMDSHTKEFFAKVSEIADENKFLFA